AGSGGGWPPPELAPVTRTGPVWRSVVFPWVCATFMLPVGAKRAGSGRYGWGRGQADRRGGRGQRDEMGQTQTGHQRTPLSRRGLAALSWSRSSAWWDGARSLARFLGRDCRSPLRIDGGGELLSCQLPVVVGEPHGEGAGACRGRRPGKLVVRVARVAEGPQGKARRELPGGQRPDVGPRPAAEEKVLCEGLTDSSAESCSAARVDAQWLVLVHEDRVGLIQRLALVAATLH